MFVALEVSRVNELTSSYRNDTLRLWSLPLITCAYPVWFCSNILLAVYSKIHFTNRMASESLGERVDDKSIYDPQLQFMDSFHGQLVKIISQRADEISVFITFSVLLRWETKLSAEAHHEFYGDCRSSNALTQYRPQLPTVAQKWTCHVYTYPLIQMWLWWEAYQFNRQRSTVSTESASFLTLVFLLSTMQRRC